MKLARKARAVVVAAAGSAVREAVLRGSAESRAGERCRPELGSVTGTIVGLAGTTRTGTIRSRDGSRLTFSAAGVLGEFESLAVGHLVSFDLDRAHPHHTAVRVFREPFGVHAPGKTMEAPPDLRYTGFHQAEGVRSYCFDAVAPGHATQQFIVTVDFTLLLKHHIGRHPVPEWIHRQVYLNPYPKELLLRNHV